jgi:hypothetical protein
MVAKIYIEHQSIHSEVKFDSKLNIQKMQYSGKLLHPDLE